MYRKFLDRLDHVLIGIAAALFFLIFAVSIAEILIRSIFGRSLLWTVDLCIILASWTMLLGGAVMVHRNDHLIVDFLINLFPGKVKRVVGLLVNIVVFLFFVVLFFVSLQSAEANMNMRFTTIGWRKGTAFYALPVFSVFSVLFMIQRVMDCVKGEKTNE